MSTNFPTSIDSFTPNPAPTDPRNAPSLAGKITNLSDSVVALETKVGVNSSAVAASLDFKVTANTAAAATNAANIVTTAGWLFASGVPAGGTGVDGNIYINTATGIIYRKTAGSWAAIYTPTTPSTSTGDFTPAGANLKGWTADPVMCTVGSAGLTVSGVLHLHKLTLAAGTITNVVMATTVGNTATNFFVALYNSAGTLLSQSANVASSLTAASGVGWKTLALGAPQVITDGVYYVGFWYAGGTSPVFYRVQSDQVLITAATSAPNLRASVSTTGLTTTAPTPFGAQTATPNLWFVGVS